MIAKVYDAEYRFMELLWEHSPINSTQLVKLCLEELGWKKSTTYTTVRRLAQRHIIQNEEATVSYLVTKDQVGIEESKEHLNKLYNGSIKMMLSNFLSKEALSMDEVKELKKLIDQQIEKGE